MSKLEEINKLSLSNLGTPIEKCENLSDFFSDGPDIYIKRDDFIGSLVWGNKLRKLEYSLADAISKRADTIITCGGVQSNHCRITAQVCKRLGLDCILIQNGTEQLIPTGNHKINRLMDTQIIYVSSSEEREAKMIEVRDIMKNRGLRPYILPLGASNGIGCLGYVNAIKELREQQEMMGLKFDYIIHSSSSGGTQAGMEIGKRLFGFKDLKILGISSDTEAEQLRKNIISCIEPALALLESDITIKKEEIKVDASYIGPGYGIPSKESDEAERIFMEYEGIMLDSTYTAKAAAGLIDYIRREEFWKNQKILFWHTGGLLADL